MTNRAIAAAVIVLGSTASFAACAPTPPDHVAINEWRESRQESSRGADVIEVLSAAAEPRTPSGASSVSFPTAERIGSLDFECYGDGTVTLGIAAQSGDTTFSRNFDAIHCANGATTLNASKLFGDAAIDDIEIIGSYPSAHTAWVAVLSRP